MDKELLSEGEVPIQSIISGDEDNGSLCHIKNEYKPIYSARRAYNYKADYQIELFSFGILGERELVLSAFSLVWGQLFMKYS